MLGVSKNTVRRRWPVDGPPKYERPATGSVVDAVEPRIRELLRECPTMPATVIAERIGWSTVDDGAQGPGPRAAAGVSAAGPGLAHDV